MPELVLPPLISIPGTDEEFPDPSDIAGPLGWRDGGVKATGGAGG